MKRKGMLMRVILIVMPVVFLWGCSPKEESQIPLDQALETMIQGVVSGDPTIRNCSLALRTGDDSIQWSGAAGIANQSNQGAMSSDTHYYVASITKTYTATVIMMLHERGLLSLDDPMTAYLPESLIRGIAVVDGVDYSNEISTYQLMSHTSGIADYYTDAPQGGQSLFDQFLTDPQKTYSVEETIEFTRDQLDAFFPPGEGCRYSDTNYQLLGKVIEGLTGKALHEVYEEFIFEPLGLENTWLVGHPRNEMQEDTLPADIFHGDRVITVLRNNGSYWADGGIVSTAEDGITFLKALNEGAIIQPESLDLMMDWKNINSPLLYGAGLDRLEHPAMDKLWGHSGSTSAFLYYCQEEDLYLAGTLSLTGANRTAFGVMAQAISLISSESN